jgi:alpha-tubulin suppressor-like RCC1 family protein
MFSGTNIVQDGTDSDWAQVSSGGYHTLALKTDGTLWARGQNGYGQLGLGHNNYVSSWVRVGNDNRWVSIAAGNYHSLAILRDGDQRMIYGWGSNSVYQLGLYPISNADKNIPTLVYRPSYASDDWNLIAAGSNHSMAIRNDGTLWTWGYNYYGQTGMAASQDTHTFYQVQMGANAGAGTFVSVAGNYNYTLAVNSDGSLWYAGGSTTHTGLQKGSVDNDWAAVFLSSSESSGHNLAMKKDGSLWSWGSNSQGELGHGDTATVYMPKKIGQ